MGRKKYDTETTTIVWSCAHAPERTFDESDPKYKGIQEFAELDGASNACKSACRSMCVGPPEMKTGSTFKRVNKSNHAETAKNFDDLPEKERESMIQAELEELL